jgi:hypothetical protein
MFLNWCINNDLISDELKEDAAEEIEQVKRRELTGAEFVMDCCDGKFSEYDLNDLGNSFAKDYYADDTDFGNRYSSLPMIMSIFLMVKLKKMTMNTKLSTTSKILMRTMI